MSIKRMRTLKQLSKEDRQLILDRYEIYRDNSPAAIGRDLNTSTLAIYRVLGEAKIIENHINGTNNMVVPNFKKEEEE